MNEVPEVEQVYDIPVPPPHTSVSVCLSVWLVLDESQDGHLWLFNTLEMG
jgi:hypothetical protein